MELWSRLARPNVMIKVPATEAGIPAICFGPGDIALAHSAEEFVPVAEIVTATRVLTSVVSEWMH